MKSGKYQTKAGSEVIVSGKHSGRYDIAFDWLEENGACCDCQPSVDDGYLVWSCDGHEGGSAVLRLVEDEQGGLGTELTNLSPNDSLGAREKE